MKIFKFQDLHALFNDIFGRVSKYSCALVRHSTDALTLLLSGSRPTNDAMVVLASCKKYLLLTRYKAEDISFFFI